MLIRRLFDARLAQASYLVGCQETKEALVVDPNRLIDSYLAAAEVEGWRITHVTETHIHADFVSGARQLARRAKAELLLSGEGGRDWSYAYAAEDGARLVHDGESFMVGTIRVTVVYTPGHTPEHVAFLLTDAGDRGKANTPSDMLSGDFIFVGDVGRPDLLERAANVSGTADDLARQLFHSVQRTADYPDDLRIWPGHGAGSACGKAIGSAPSTLFGNERLGNWAFQIADEDEFVREALAGQSEPPRYFALMKQLNRDGPPPLGPGGRATLRQLPSVLSLGDVEERMRADAWIIDIRSSAEFAAGHIPGTVNIQGGDAFATRIGSLVPYDRDVVLVTSDRAGAGLTPALAKLTASLEGLQLIGFDRVVGVSDASILEEWVASGRELETTPQIDARALAALVDSGNVRVLDVRNDHEWHDGHIPGATHAVLNDLVESTASLPRDLAIVTHCQGGTRSSIAASLLRANGFTNVTNLAGGIDAWTSDGLPISHDS